MHRSKLFSRVATRPVALLLTVGVLLVGLSACGSSSSTTSKRSSSSVVKKQAGGLTKDTQAIVLNHTSKTVSVHFCGDLESPACQDVDIHPGNAGSMRGTKVYGTVYFYKEEPVTYPDGSTNKQITNQVDFVSENPTVGEPWLSVHEVLTGTAGQDAWVNPQPKWHLSEGQAEDITVQGLPFTVSRSADTSDFKVMTLTPH